MSLRRIDLDENPTKQFKKWFDEAGGKGIVGRIRKFLIRAYKSVLMIQSSEVIDVNAMVLSTADLQARPSARVVLLKGVDDRGFIFFTSYESRKSQELAENPNAALVFYWSNLEREVSINGNVKKLSPEESTAYFKTRPRGSQIAACASHQSEIIANRSVLEDQVKELESQYRGREIAMPFNWGGYILIPNRFEFWQGRPNRLHDRFCYTKEPDHSWKIERLSP